jgi:hypothetical protein
MFDCKFSHARVEELCDAQTLSFANLRSCAQKKLMDYSALTRSVSTYQQTMASVQRVLRLFDNAGHLHQSVDTIETLRNGLIGMHLNVCRLEAAHRSKDRAKLLVLAALLHNKVSPYFVPVPAWEGPHEGELPKRYPKSVDDLFHWSESRIVKILNFYNITDMSAKSLQTRHRRVLTAITEGQ